MLNGKWTSIKEIIAKVYRDTGAQEEITWEDLVEWAAEPLMLLDMPDTYVKKVIGHYNYSPFDVTNYKAKLPCDFHKLNQLAINGVPAVYSGDSFHHLLSGECCGIDDLGTVEGDLFTDNAGNVFNTAEGTRFGTVPLSFDINNDYLTLSVKEGKVCMSYWAVPTDEDGFPLIPSADSFREAVTKYLIMKLDYIRWRKEPSNSGLRALYDDSKQEYMWYVGQASNKAKMPDTSKMEQIKRQMLRLKPEINHFDRFFRTVNAPERKYIK